MRRPTGARHSNTMLIKNADRRAFGPMPRPTIESLRAQAVALASASLDGPVGDQTVERDRQVRLRQGEDPVDRGAYYPSLDYFF